MYALLYIPYRSFNSNSVTVTAIKDKIIEEDEAEIRPEMVLASCLDGKLGMYKCMLIEIAKDTY